MNKAVIEEARSNHAEDSCGKDSYDFAVYYLQFVTFGNIMSAAAQTV